MRNVKFVLFAAAILLVGAIAAGLAAQSVVSPRTGEIHSAGVLNIPTVLGQTAEEVLFYPWSMYDTQSLRHFTENELLDVMGLNCFGATMEEVHLLLSEIDGNIGDIDLASETLLPLFDNFHLFMPLSFQWADLIDTLEVNLGESGRSPAAGTQLFLKDFPATAALDSQVPVTLNFALNAGSNKESISFLIRPAQPRTLTEKEQAAALERVENDLRLFLLYDHMFTVEAEPGSNLSSKMADTPSSSEMRQLVQFFCEQNTNLSQHMIQLNSTLFNLQYYFAELADLSPLTPIDEFLTAVEASTGWSIQIITTQQQIVVLFTSDNGYVFGIYYDIQLGYYSGIGINYQT